MSKQRTSLFVLLLSLLMPANVVAAAEPVPPLRSAMQAGAEAAASCQAQIEHDADELVGCVLARTRPSDALSARLAQGHRLGALFRGWVMADVAAGYTLPGAEAAAEELLRTLLPLQAELEVQDEQLCELLPAACPAAINRKREVLTSPAFATPASKKANSPEHKGTEGKSKDTKENE